MAQALTSQINIRIGSELKECGDAALSQMGYTASEVIRSIWTLAASGGNGMERLKQVLAEGTRLEREGKGYIANESVGPMPWELYDHYVALLGEGSGVVPTAMSDDELLEAEMLERMREKGLQ